MGWENGGGPPTGEHCVNLTVLFESSMISISRGLLADKTPRDVLERSFSVVPLDHGLKLFAHALLGQNPN